MSPIPNTLTANPTDVQLWLSYAYFEIRRQDVTAARKVLGVSIGMCPKPKLFTGYIELEMRLREFDRVRTLYEKFLTVSLIGQGITEQKS
jgi:crooked neck